MPSPRTEPPFAADETTTLRAFLDYYRATLRRQTEDLDAAGLRATLAPSDLTLGGMLAHLAYVEDWWFGVVLRGAAPRPPWDAADWSADPDADWHSAADLDGPTLRRAYDDAVAASEAHLDAALAEGDLDQPCAFARPSDGARPNLRYVLVHLVEEYARHAGHADLLRQSVDGATDL